MSGLGLGCVKTQQRCDGLERAFHEVSFLVIETSRGCSVAIDFGKLFSSSFDFSSFYTARVKTGSRGPAPGLLLCPQQWTSTARHACPKGAEVPLYSITSSARPSSESGNVMPSALADFRLMYSSTFVDCWTGKSFGFSPFRIRPV